MNARKAKRIAIRILDEKSVTIPSSHREARLYGSEYYTFKDAITRILAEETKGWGEARDSVGLLDR